MLAASVALWLGLLITLPARSSPWLAAASGLPVLALASWREARRRGVPWRTLVTQTSDWHGLGLVLLYGVATLVSDAHGITTDGTTYFAQLRSLVFDHDLDITREYQILGQPLRPNYVVPIGPTVIWAPLYLIVALVDTNCNPDFVDYVIPGNDDASKSISIITNYMVQAIREGMEERKQVKGEAAAGAEA